MVIWVWVLLAAVLVAILFFIFKVREGGKSGARSWVPGILVSRDSNVKFVRSRGSSGENGMFSSSSKPRVIRTLEDGLDDGLKGVVDNVKTQNDVGSNRYSVGSVSKRVSSGDDFENEFSEVGRGFSNNDSNDSKKVYVMFFGSDSSRLVDILKGYGFALYKYKGVRFATTSSYKSLGNFMVNVSRKVVERTGCSDMVFHLVGSGRGFFVSDYFPVVSDILRERKGVLFSRELIPKFNRGDSFSYVRTFNVAGSPVKLYRLAS